jgi:hypothetical protein
MSDDIELALRAIENKVIVPPKVVEESIKYKYKAGDKVWVIDDPIRQENCSFVSNMQPFIGTQVTIRDTKKVLINGTKIPRYLIVENSNTWLETWFTDVAPVIPKDEDRNKVRFVPNDFKIRNTKVRWKGYTTGTYNSNHPINKKSIYYTYNVYNTSKDITKSIIQIGLSLGRCDYNCSFIAVSYTHLTLPTM